MIQGYYYLHVNGDLIYKPGSESIVDIRDSDLATCAWASDPSDREAAWNICVEGMALGAKTARVKELASKWGLTDEDAAEYAKRMGITLSMDGNLHCATGPGFTNLMEHPAGFGGTALEAMAALAKALEVEGGKMWRVSFKDKLKALA